MNYSTYKSYINAGIFVGSILLTRLSTMVSPTMAYACTILSIALLLYLIISLAYNTYHTKDAYSSRAVRSPLSFLLFFSTLLALRWLEGYPLKDPYGMLTTVNLTLIAVYVYTYVFTYIAPRVNHYFSKK